MYPPRQRNQIKLEAVWREVENRVWTMPQTFFRYFISDLFQLYLCQQPYLVILSVAIHGPGNTRTVIIIIIIMTYLVILSVAIHDPVNTRAVSGELSSSPQSVEGVCEICYEIERPNASFLSISQRPASLSQWTDVSC